MNKNRMIIITVFLMISRNLIALSSDQHTFSLINNSNEDFDIEISYGASGTAATTPRFAKNANMDVGENYQDKQLFTFHRGEGIDIQKNQIKRYPMYIRLLRETPGGHSSSNVFQLSDKSVRKEIAIGVDNVMNKSGVVINQDSAGVVSYKYYDRRPDTKVIRRSFTRMDDER